MRGFSWPLQRALVAALVADPVVAELSGGQVLDEPLSETAPGGPAILLGDETVLPWATATDQGAEHRIEIAVVGQEHGFARLKPLADAVCAVVLAPLPLERGRIVNAVFLAARTRRDAVRHLRRIDMSFRIVVEDDADTAGE
jgi:hypothetical protein